MEMIEEDVGEENRAVVCQGAVVLRRGWKRNKRYLTLFTDVLVISSKLNKKKFKVKHVIPLTYLWLGNEVDIFRTDNSPASKSIYLYWPMGNAVVTFCSMEETIWWYFFLQRSIRDAKKQNKTDLSLQISTEDIAYCDTPLYVTATNFDTVNDIISKLLPMMRKHSIEDYQLWFCSRPGEAPRVLQGNDYPHDIIMINIQKNFTSRDLRNFTAFPSLPGLIMKYLNADAQGQFILRPRNSARSQKNMKEKTLKKQRTSTSSWWHSISVPHPDQICTTQNLNNGGKLFGRELGSICQDGNLPSAILDMLSLLKREGPTTEGVFLLRPSITLCQTIKDKLDSEEEVDMNKQSVHVVSWIFKDFLKKIEGSLMTSKLYDEWIAVTKKVDEEEKLAAVQSLLDKLPPANAALLRQFFQILYEIKSNSPVTEMSSYHLSVGIAPCLLFMPSSCNNGRTKDIAKKISLVTFMIENCPKIFGEDVVAVPYETSLSHPPGAKSSCSLNTAANIRNVKKTERGLSRCPAGRTCTPGYHARPGSPAAPLPCEGPLGSGKHERKVHTIPSVVSPNRLRSTKKSLFGQPLTSIFEDNKLPTPIIDMMSIIAEKGQSSDHLFKTMSENSHCSLRDKIDTELCIKWNEECVLVVASVLKDFISNIDGSLLTSNLYENWLTIPDEGTLAGKISAIQSLLQQIPEPNFILLKYLICLLVIIKDSPMNKLDTKRLSIRLAPHVLWGWTSSNSLFGKVVSRKERTEQLPPISGRG
nr:rho GTPase-activating protein 20-like isoform X3 [Rattus norvegicus]